MAIKPEEIPARDYSLCPLHGYEIPCSVGEWDLHHIISRGKASKSRAQPKLDVRYNLIWVCSAHNVSRFADSKKAMRFLFGLQCLRYDYEVIAEFLDGLPWKVARPEYSSKALLD